MNNESSYQNAQTRNFFETHGSGEIVTAWRCAYNGISYGITECRLSHFNP